MTTFNLAELWEVLTDAGPDAECLVGGDQRRTRRQLDDRASQLAHELLANGVGRNDHVGVYSLNRVEFVEAMLACWKLAAVPININWRYVAKELRYVVDNADLAAMVIERAYLPVFDEIAPDFPSVQHVVVLEDGTDHQPVNVQAVEYEAALAAQPTTRDFGIERSDDDRYLLYTGGTTGMPKGVEWRHEDVFYGCMGGGNYYDPIARADDIVINATEPGLPMNPLAIAPLMHGGGQWPTFIGLYSGGKSVVYTERSYDADTVLKLCQDEDVMTLSLVGDAMARPLAEAKLAGSYELPCLVNIGSGGAMLTKPVKDQLREAFPGVIITDGYGASETGSAAVGIDNDNDMDAVKFTVDANTAVLDDDLERIPAGSGRKGMLARTGHIPLGYYKDPVKTAETFVTDPHGTRWVVPGDLAEIDADGMLVLYGRGSQCINSGGEKVFPEEVEAACRAHPDVYDAIVTGVPDERFGNTVVALVQLRDGAPELTLDELQEHCRQEIAGYKLPRAIVVGPVQRTNVGKQDYVWAKERALEALGG